MCNKIIFSLLLLLGPVLLRAQSHPSSPFEIRDGDFWLKGKAVKIHSGEMHYARIPREYWQHRLRMLHAMGMNTVCTYVFWNFHETVPGTWDFESDNKNLREFIELAAAEGLMVILRPGPYACAEWEFGGYPWWLPLNPNLVIRGNNRSFLDSCNVYIKHLADQIRDLQVTRGGPIIMVQVENEFGSYVAQRKDISLDGHKAYSATIRQQLINAGIEVPLFTSDGSWLFAEGTIEGALPTANGEGDVEKLKTLVNQYHGGVGPYMVAEFYPGWLDHWAEPFVKVSTQEVVAQLQKYLQGGVSFNFYMAHGGTNFGFTSGANYDNLHGIQPDITSYDYDAPISEAGWATDKYKAIREEMLPYTQDKIPDIPSALPRIEIPNIPLKVLGNLDDIIGTVQAVVADEPMTFEELGLGSGYALYSREFAHSSTGVLSVTGLRDFATVYVNGNRVGTLNRNNNSYELPVSVPAGGTLQLLVENMGRINYGSEIVNNNKGIISAVKMDGEPVHGNWKMYPLPMGSVPVIAKTHQPAKGTPVLYKGRFDLRTTGDTFLDMHQWGKGIVYVNGHHLGRYWQVGPQQTLYVPGCWLHKGRNEFVIFEQLNEVPHSRVGTVMDPVLEQLQTK